jgi:hypothetical protein
MCLKILMTDFVSKLAYVFNYRIY